MTPPIHGSGATFADQLLRAKRLVPPMPTHLPSSTYSYTYSYTPISSIIFEDENDEEDE